jgi:tight adherence protein C
MSTLTVVVASFGLVAGVTLLAGLTLMRFWPALQRERFGGTRAAPAGATSILRWSEAPSSGWEQTIERIGRAVGGSEESAPTKYRQRLIRAGYYEPRAVLLFLGAKVALGAGLGSLYFLYSLVALKAVAFPRLLAISLILAVVGFFLPDFWLYNRTKVRRREIVHALPDVLDLLMVCVEAGLGFDAAVARVAEQPSKQQSPLHNELRRMHLEVRAGRPRQEAMRALADRSGVEELKSIVGAFIQTEKLGTPLGKTLRVHADAARVQRRHRAEHRAHMAPLKMLFPTVFFLMPAFFLVTLAPSLLGLLKLLKALSY